MTQNFGRELIFSADLWYNRANEKPPFEREGDRVSGGRSLRDFEFGLTLLSRILPQSPTAPAPLPEGAYGCARASLGVWALPEAFVLQMQNWR